jgi:phosphoglycerol transferase MdoB-like AlkP superfamily enzyme
MTNVNNTSGKDDGRMSRYVPENYVGFKVFVVLLVLAIVALVALFANIKASHAMSVEQGSTVASDFLPTNEVSNPCIPYTHAMVTKGQGFYSHTITLTHGACDGTNANTVKDTDNTPTVAQNDTKVTLSLPVVTVDTTRVEIPVIKQNDTESNDTPSVTEDSKQKCNNGEGNGSEGCSPAKSDNANNDENSTTPKQDKSNGQES